MKRLLAFLFAALLCLPLAACSSELAVTETAVGSATAESTAKTEEIKETGPITYPEGFSVGFSRVVITGQVPLPIYNTVATGIHDDLFLTCTALCDGEEVALIFSVDSWFVTDAVTQTACKRLNKELGIKPENVMFNSTHAHSAPNISTSDNPEITRYVVMFYKQVLDGAEKALRDLDVVENAFTGIGHTEGITFVRRYLMGDGSYKGIGSNNPSEDYVSHETDADNEMRTVRFDRKNKKDVLMVNYQTHYGGATALYPDQLSADFITPFREEAEKEFDCLFAYQYGASGNLNFISFIPGERKYPTYLEAIEGFMTTTREALSKEGSLSLGKLQSRASVVTATVQKDSEEIIAKAKECKEASSNEAKQGQLLALYGFESKMEVNAIVTRNNLGETEDLPLSVITFGELAFAAFPYEMFDTSGRQVREASPFKTTFICSLTNGSHGYIPTQEVFPHRCYEVYVTRYLQGTAELCVAESVRPLNECKNAA